MKWIFALILLQASPLDSPASIPRVSMDDICLSHVVTREAVGEGLVGMRAVYDAIQERSRRRNLSLCDTVRQKSQFASVKAGEKFKYSNKLLTILAEVRRVPTIVRGADFFHSRMEHPPSWSRKFKLIAVVKGHRFYSSV